jgi:hypothetical protein
MSGPLVEAERAGPEEGLGGGEEAADVRGDVWRGALCGEGGLER